MARITRKQRIENLCVVALTDENNANEQVKATPALKDKINLLLDFGITEIPAGYFKNARGQRDLDIRADELINRKLTLDEFMVKTA